jgi:hypothetical protein
MSDRPTEGPDREALRQQIVAQAHYVLTSPVSPYRRPEERIADAVLALLPTPPAPGGEETREDYWKRRFHEEADAHDRTATDLIAARRGLSAPGGGEGLRATDLRAEVDVLARVLMAAWEKAEGKPVNPSYVATFADMARAALAARDTDQGARDALAEVERLRDDMASTPSIITVSREHVVRRLTAALAARDTDQGARDALAQVRARLAELRRLHDEWMGQNDYVANSAQHHFLMAAKRLAKDDDLLAALARATPEADQ